MNDTDQIIYHLLETDEDPEEFDLKDLTEPGDELVAGPTDVKRFGRWKLVDMPRYTFLISYLTPVAYLDKVFGTYYETLKYWSPTTKQHIHDWQRMIWASQSWKDNPANWEKSEVNPENHYVRYPRFKRVRQAKISGLFRSLIPTMQMKPHLKRRMYHVDPGMRQGNNSGGGHWESGHLKHHDTGEEGLPMPNERSYGLPKPDYGDFFKDFQPSEPEYYDWGSGLRNTHPYERGKPDEE
jgi:hypothetical protein